MSKNKSNQQECPHSKGSKNHLGKCAACDGQDTAEWEEYVDKWSKQGRSEEQIWAVRNFMTGQGALMMKNFIPRKEVEAAIGEDEYDSKIGVTSHDEMVADIRDDFRAELRQKLGLERGE